MNQDAIKNVERRCAQSLIHSQRFCSEVQKERIVSRITANEEVTGFGRSTNVVEAEQRNAEYCHLLPLMVHRFLCPLAVIIQETFFCTVIFLYPCQPANLIFSICFLCCLSVSKLDLCAK